MSSHSSKEAEVVAGGLLFGIALMLLFAWLAAQVLGLVVRTVALHAGNTILRWALGVALVATLLAGLFGFRAPALNLLAGLSVATLVATCWAIETYYEAILKRAVTRERLVQDVLGSSWW